MARRAQSTSWARPLVPGAVVAAAVILITTGLVGIPVADAATWVIPCGSSPDFAPVIQSIVNSHRPGTIDLAPNCTYDLPGGGLTIRGATITLNGDGSTISGDGTASPSSLIYIGSTGSLTANDITLSN